MPKMNDPTVTQITGSGFEFSATSAAELSADSDEWTIVDILVDLSSSICGNERDMERLVKGIVADCRKSPRCENLMLRVCGFNDNDGVFEIHGYIKLMDIVPDRYDNAFRPGGLTPLLDAMLNAVEAAGQYGRDLDDKDIVANSIIVVLTDGDENRSKIATIGAPSASDAKVFGAQKVAKAKKGVNREEKLESMRTMLIGISDEDNDYLTPLLKEINTNAQFDQFEYLGNMNKNTFAKAVGFISQSISSQSQALGTGGPSQAIDPATVVSVDLDDI
jgi:hypothetical protein